MTTRHVGMDLPANNANGRGYGYGTYRGLAMCGEFVAWGDFLCLPPLRRMQPASTSSWCPQEDMMCQRCQSAFDRWRTERDLPRIELGYEG